MLRQLILGLVVLALLTSCTGIALPETMSEVTMEEIAPLSDQQALAEFQLEASGQIGFADESAVPVPVEDIVPVTDGRLIKEQLEREAIQSAGAGLLRPIEEVVPVTDGRLIKDRLELEAMQSSGAGVALPTLPASTDDIWYDGTEGIWYDGNVIIGYGSTDAKMPAKLNAVPESLLESNPVYYDWLMENK